MSIKNSLSAGVSARGRGGDSCAGGLSEPAGTPPAPPALGKGGQVLGFRVHGSGFWVLGSGFRVLGSGFRVLGLGFRVQRVGLRVEGALIRKRGHFTPARKMRRDVRALTARNHPEGRWEGAGVSVRGALTG